MTALKAMKMDMGDVVRKRKKKSTSRQSAVRALDKAFGDYIKARDGVCVICGTDKNLTCGHLFTRAAYSTRWNPNNAFCQCSSCNLRHEYDFYPLDSYARARHGNEAIDELHVVHKTPMKFKTYQLEEMARYWTRKANEIREGKS